MRQFRCWWLHAALVVMIWGTYFPIWQNGYVNFDDPRITDTPEITAGLTRESVSWALSNAESPYRAPATWLSLQLDAELSARIWPGSPAPRPELVHAQNLLWHSLNTLLVFVLCRRLPGGTDGCAFLVAALFAVHPMHVESVAWAIERKDVLMCAFGLLAVLAYLRFGETRRRRFYVLSLGMMALSLAAKPMLLTLPCVLLLLDYWPLRRIGASSAVPGEPERVPRGRPLLEKVPFFALALVVALETSATHPSVTFASIPLLDRVMNVLSGYGWYIRTTFWPAPLAVLYPHLHDDWSWAAVVTGAAMLAAITTLAVWQARRRPWFAVGWFWFVGTLFPVMGFEQVGSQAWADRFSYWPHIGLFLALVWAASELVTRLRVPRFASGIVVTGVLACLMVLSWVQVRYWRDSVTLWEHTVAVTDRNPAARERLAATYQQQGRREEAHAQTIAAGELIRARTLRQIRGGKR